MAYFPAFSGKNVKAVFLFKTINRVFPAHAGIHHVRSPPSTHVAKLFPCINGRRWPPACAGDALMIAKDALSKTPLTCAEGIVFGFLPGAKGYFPEKLFLTNFPFNPLDCFVIFYFNRTICAEGGVRVWLGMPILLPNKRS
jgi:hypothetical protein